jgi:hypothetical protein
MQSHERFGAMIRLVNRRRNDRRLAGDSAVVDDRSEQALSQANDGGGCAIPSG